MAPSKEVDAYIADLDEKRRVIAEHLRALVFEAIPEAEETIKWRKPTFVVGGGNVAYLDAAKGYVKFGFFDAREIEDPDGLLSGSGKKMRHIKVSDVDSLPDESVKRMLRQAAAKAG